MTSMKLPALLTLALLLPVAGRAAEPIRIGVISEAQAVAGASIAPAAQLAAEEINAKGGIDGRLVEIVAYDDHSSASDAVRAFQRAVNEDHVQAVVASFITEIALALQPWADRLKTVTITPGAASDLIPEAIAKDFAHNRYYFQGFPTSSAVAHLVCDSSKDLLVKHLGMRTAVIMSEDAAWTLPLDAAYETCLPEAGLKPLDHIRFSKDTTDFTPIFNRIEALKPDVIITGVSHVGVQPTVQWKNQQVPLPMYGRSSQAINPVFWKDTDGGAQGVILQAFAAPDVALSPKTIPFAEAYRRKYGAFPAETGYTAYDAVHYIADAVHRAGATDADKLAAALEKTDYEGAVGHIQFLPPGDPHAHAIRVGPGFIQGVMMQWQDGKQVTVWPANLANGEMRFPSYIVTKR